MTYILGLNAYHADAAACLVKDGELVAAVEEERFRRIKHWGGFPSESIRYCLAEAGISLADVAHVAVNTDNRAHRWRKLAFILTSGISPSYVLKRLQARRERTDIAGNLRDHLPEQEFRGTVHAVEHHLCHLASAFLVSPFPRAVAVSVDGFGDFSSAAWGLGEDSRLAVDGGVYFPHSLGVFYEAMTQFIGFPHYGDEYKVMGLAPYGEPHFVDQMGDLIYLKNDGTFELNLRYFRHASGQGANYEVKDGIPSGGQLWNERITGLLGPARDPSAPLEDRHRDIARSAQATYEKAFFNLLGAVHKRYGTDAVVLAGGCAYNSVANGKIFEQSPFKKVYIQSAGGDAGGSIGAAFATWHKVEGDKARRHFVMDHAYWGPSATPAQIAGAIAARQSDFDAEHCTIEQIDDEAALCARTAQAISEGKVIGWFQGRLEWGPRALGNRSILGDPRRSDMKDILNLKIKRRESFRPFAPSILRESVKDWFETDDDVPFMMQVFKIRSEKRKEIPAVTHVDGSGRLQTVTRSANPRYWALISAFRELSGVPIVLNTSFNENEPVVCKPEEAIDCFLRTKMDVLVLGDTFISR
ncbi:carbamoyltransferase [Enhydrobacter aerosaccus]|uniref:Carbamoyltransferase n=1 Tax=Enhydrobacter aerosaccus TaxID=225324 RepID=A0A1T4RGX0_9HYPH|nr:carbamoyltransferase C-terminal domain-containing protein [Enhydrobacter aerosaccus]SKA15159.1 carbamoyltransferase [Enhydrobacter aerosaccus]